MKLIAHEILTGAAIDQTMTAQRNVIVEAVRPHIVRYGSPTGSLKIQILTTGEVLVAESEAVAIEDIGSATHFHGDVRFLINAYLAKDTSYIFRLVSEDGYTFSESAYIGWCNGYDLAKYPNESTPVSDVQHPLAIEIWERKVK